MVAPSPDPTAQDDMRVGPVHESPPGTPRWVKMFGIIILLLILGFVILKLAGVGGDHGPGRHTSSDGVEGLTVAIYVAGASEVTIPHTVLFRSSRADVLMGQTVSFLAITGSQAVHESTPMDPAMQWFSDGNPIHHVTQGLTGMPQA